MTPKEMAEKLREEAQATRDNYVYKIVEEDESQPAHLEKQQQKNQLLIMDALAMLLDVNSSSTSTW